MIATERAASPPIGFSGQGRLSTSAVHTTAGETACRGQFVTLADQCRTSCERGLGRTGRGRVLKPMVAERLLAILNVSGNTLP